MNLYYTLISLLLSSLVAAESLSFFGGSQRVLGDEGTQIPGDSPLEHCDSNTDGDILKIYYINLKPNPPTAGETLVIEAKGEFLEDVEEGAYVRVQVKYGLIRVVNMVADMCEQVRNVDLECPLRKGEAVLTKTVDLPKEIPPGKYTVIADVRNQSDERITCLTAAIDFPR